MRRFLADRRGNAVITFGLLAVPIMSVIGLSIDYGNMSRARSHAQQALDSVAIPSARQADGGEDDAVVETLANNLFTDEYAGSTTHQTPGPWAVDYLGITYDADGNGIHTFEVPVTYNFVIPRFWKENSADQETMTIRTAVSSIPGTPACLFALSPTAGRAMEVTGSATIDTGSCIVGSNSKADDSVYIGGAGDLDTGCIRSSGGIDDSGGLSMDCDAAQTNASASPDPFASIPEPDRPTDLEDAPKKDAKSTVTIGPGRYSGLKLDGSFHLEPGVYYIEGDLDIKGELTGTGITFYMKSGGITVNANADLDISAPTTGDQAGMLFMSADGNLSAHKFNGGGTLDLDGYMYFPDGSVTYNGNASATATCLRIVAQTVSMTGNTDIKFDCAAELGGREYLIGGGYRFVL